MTNPLAEGSRMVVKNNICCVSMKIYLRGTKTVKVISCHGIHAVYVFARGKEAASTGQ